MFASKFKIKKAGLYNFKKIRNFFKTINRLDPPLNNFLAKQAISMVLTKIKIWVKSKIYDIGSPQRILCCQCFVHSLGYQSIRTFPYETIIIKMQKL